MADAVESVLVHFDYLQAKKTYVFSNIVCIENDVFHILGGKFMFFVYVLMLCLF
jgi:hypothetical protein